jgi:hypothetical protein
LSGNFVIRRSSSGSIHSRASQRLALPESRGSSRQSSKPKVSQKRCQCPSDVQPMKTWPPSEAVKTSYTPQAFLRAGIGGSGPPITALPTTNAPSMNVALSNRELATFCPMPVASRSRSAASAATTPNTPPRISMTGAPARNGRPGGPVM